MRLVRARGRGTPKTHRPGRLYNSIIKNAITLNKSLLVLVQLILTAGELVFNKQNFENLLTYGQNPAIMLSAVEGNRLFQGG